MTYALAKFEVATSNSLGGDAFTRKYIFSAFKVTQNVAQYLLHCLTYAPAKFEVAMSNGLGEYNYRKCNGWTYTCTDGGRDNRPTLVQNEYTFFSNEKKAGIIKKGKEVVSFAYIFHSVLKKEIAI